MVNLQRGIINTMRLIINKLQMTNNEHFERWHGGNYQNDTNGVPNNPDFPEEFEDFNKH